MAEDAVEEAVFVSGHRFSDAASAYDGRPFKDWAYRTFSQVLAHRG
jgi:hypothetical protein